MVFLFFFLLRLLTDSPGGAEAPPPSCSGGSRRGGVAEKSKTSPFNFLKTFQHLFCTLTYAKLQGATVTGVPFQAQRGAGELLSCKMRASERSVKMD